MFVLIADHLCNLATSEDAAASGSSFGNLVMGEKPPGKYMSMFPSLWQSADFSRLEREVNESLEKARNGPCDVPLEMMLVGGRWHKNTKGSKHHSKGFNGNGFHEY
jgi:hypothetical protein